MFVSTLNFAMLIIVQLGSDGQIILKWIIKKYDGKAWQALVKMTHNMQEIS
jgi:hypothetical protein